MSSLHLAIVTRRFWPHCGVGEISVAELACAIERAGHRAEIITVRWDKTWPRKFTFREIEVTRISQPISGTWGAFRFLRNLSRHVKDLDLDGLIIHGLRDESWASIRSFSPELPTIVRLDQNELNSESHNTFTSRQLTALKSVKKILVDSDWTADRLTRHNAIPNELVSIVPEAVEVDHEYQRSISSQGTVRLALSDAHPILMIDPTQPLVVCGAPLNGDRGVCDLVDAWPRVLQRFPRARLWILGDGSQGRMVWDRIADANLADSIVMPGNFDDLSDIFQAADVYVHPARSESSCGCFTRALATGTCTIATSTAASRQMVEKNVNGLLTPLQDPRALAEAINLALNSSEIRERLGRAARQKTINEYDIDNLVSEYLKPFQVTADCEIQTVI